MPQKSRIIHMFECETSLNSPDLVTDLCWRLPDNHLLSEIMKPRTLKFRSARIPAVNECDLKPENLLIHRFHCEQEERFLI